MDFENAYQHLTNNSSDWEFRLVFADWLEENGQPILANGQRSQVWKKRRPRRLKTRWKWARYLTHAEQRALLSERSPRRLRQSGLGSWHRGFPWSLNAETFAELAEVPPIAWHLIDHRSWNGFTRLSRQPGRRDIKSTAKQLSQVERSLAIVLDDLNVVAPVEALQSDTRQRLGRGS